MAFFLGIENSPVAFLQGFSSFGRVLKAFGGGDPLSVLERTVSLGVISPFWRKYLFLAN